VIASHRGVQSTVHYSILNKPSISGNPVISRQVFSQIHIWMKPLQKVIDWHPGCLPFYG